MVIIKTYIVPNKGMWSVYPTSEFVKIHMMSDGSFISENSKGELKKLKNKAVESLIVFD